MATVTGNALDITGGSMDSREVKVVFTLNQTNIRMVTGGLRPDNSVKVTPESNGDFDVKLEPTTGMALDAWYDVSLEWLQGGVPLAGWLGVKIRVPAAGGRIDQLVDLSAGGGGGGNFNGRIVWVGQSPPVRPYPFMLWLEQEPGPDPDPLDPRNTSILHEWRP